jgi:TonB family protein
MIRPLLVFGLVLSVGSVALSAQNSDSTSVPDSLSMACAVETGPPSKTPHSWVAVSGGLMARNRIGGKNPKYPSDAKKAHIEGRVVLRATISDSGEVADLCVIQGPEMLQRAAFDAVKGWKYKPFVMNGHPVEVRTQMNVDFVLR